MKTEFHISYETHNYCATCLEWFGKSETAGKFCPLCNKSLRKNQRFKSKVDRWASAY
jgi:predicted amidophosphoribosyltransferase